MSIWDVDTLEEEERGATLTVNGVVKEVEVGSNFRDTILSEARNAGYKKFRVFVDGEELDDPSEAPEVIAEGMDISIRPYDVAG